VPGVLGRFWGCAFHNKKLRRKKGGVDVLKKMRSEAEHFCLLESAATAKIKT
jgi:hypothetical protein